MENVSTRQRQQSRGAHAPVARLCCRRRRGRGRALSGRCQQQLRRQQRCEHCMPERHSRWESPPPVGVRSEQCEGEPDRVHTGTGDGGEHTSGPAPWRRWGMALSGGRQAAQIRRRTWRRQAERAPCCPPPSWCLELKGGSESGDVQARRGARLSEEGEAPRRRRVVGTRPRPKHAAPLTWRAAGAAVTDAKLHLAPPEAAEEGEAPGGARAGCCASGRSLSHKAAGRTWLQLRMRGCHSSWVPRQPGGAMSWVRALAGGGAVGK